MDFFTNLCGGCRGRDDTDEAGLPMRFRKGDDQRAFAKDLYRRQFPGKAMDQEIVSIWVMDRKTSRSIRGLARDRRGSCTLAMAGTKAKGEATKEGNAPPSMVLWSCDSGHSWWATTDEVRFGIWCPSCGNGAMSAELTLDVDTREIGAILKEAAFSVGFKEDMSHILNIRPDQVVIDADPSSHHLRCSFRTTAVKFHIESVDPKLRASFHALCTGQNLSVLPSLSEHLGLGVKATAMRILTPTTKSKDPSRRASSDDASPRKARTPGDFHAPRHSTPAGGTTRQAADEKKAVSWGTGKGRTRSSPGAAPKMAGSPSIRSILAIGGQDRTPASPRGSDITARLAAKAARAAAERGDSDDLPDGGSGGGEKTW